MNRRTFINTAGLLTGALVLSDFELLAKSRKSIGLQLYTLKDIIEKDTVKVLNEIGNIGYTQLEAYGYADGKIFGMAYGEFAKIVSGIGMKIVSGHYSTGYDGTTKGTLRNEWARAVDDAKKASHKYMVIPSLATEERNSVDALKKVCELMNKGGEVCRQNGIRLAFHNHADEFQKLDGQLIYDIMLKELDPKVVTMELDLYWVTFAGYNPLEYFKKHPGRFELWHVKDMDKTNRNRNSNVGEGAMDFKAIFASAGQAGMKHFFLEQEYFESSSLESIKKGFAYLKSIV